MTFEDSESAAMNAETGDCGPSSSVEVNKSTNIPPALCSDSKRQGGAFQGKRNKYYLCTKYVLFPGDHVPELGVNAVDAISLSSEPPSVEQHQNTIRQRRVRYSEDVESISKLDSHSKPQQHPLIKRKYFKTPKHSLIAFLLPPTQKDRNVRFLTYAFIFLFCMYLLNLMFVAIGIQITRMMFEFYPQLVTVKDLCSSCSIPFEFKGVVTSPSYVDIYFKKLRIDVTIPSITPDKPILQIAIDNWTFYGRNVENVLDLPLVLELDESYGFPEFFSNEDFVRYKLSIYFEVDLRSLWLPTLLPFHIKPKTEIQIMTSYRRVVPFILHQINLIQTTKKVIKAKLLMEYDHSLSFLRLTLPPVSGNLTLEPYDQIAPSKSIHYLCGMNLPLFRIVCVSP